MLQTSYFDSFEVNFFRSSPLQGGCFRRVPSNIFIVAMPDDGNFPKVLSSKKIMKIF